MNVKYNKYVQELKRLKAKCEQEGREATPEELERAEYLMDFLDSVDKPDNRFLPDVGNTQRANSPFKSFGEQLQSIVRAETPGGQVDPRLHEVRAATGLSEGIGGDGGFLVPTQYSSNILQKVYSTGEIIKRCYSHPMTSNQATLPYVDESSRVAGSRHGGVRGYWVAEAAEKTASQPKFGRMELNLSKAVVLVYCTDELLEDAAGLEAYVNKVATEEIQFMIEDGIINGTGAGRPLGVMNAGCLVTQGKETGQAATTFVYENALKMWSRLYGASRKNAVWLINQNVEPQLYTMALSVGTGGSPVFLPGGGASEAPYATLFGRPVIPVEYCQTLGTAGDVILGDFSQYVLGTKGGLQADVSIHVRFIYDEQILRFVFRVDGQPWWASALTPFKGSSTQSPFVCCIAR